jgi:hypothetical protein
VGNELPTLPDWNGKSYAVQRFEYQGKRCKPQR